LSKLLALEKVLTAAGHPPVVLAGDGGERILVLPHGGRILGLSFPGSDENLLWISAALDDEATTSEHFESDDWRNSGGDRTWLTPEIHFFYPRFPDNSIYFQPRQLDPGNYQVRETGVGVALENQCVMHSFRENWDVHLTLVKLVTPTSCPLADRPHGVSFAGYRLATTMKLSEASSDRVRIGLWHLLQLPPRGEMIVPLHSPATPTHYFGEIPPGHLRVEADCIRYRMDAPNEQKIGVGPAALTGRTGYRLDDSNKSTLVIRNFYVEPHGDYADVPLDDPNCPGDAFQACSVNTPRLGTFAEMEYHVPAIGGASGTKVCEDESEVWAFGGSREQIDAIAIELLGVGC
jgi:hypothetical protein